MDSLQKAINNFNIEYPAQFHLPGHSGRYMDKSYERMINEHGMMKVDGSWMGLKDVPGLLMDGKY